MAAVIDSPSQTTGRWSKIAPLFAVLFVAFVVASVAVTNSPKSDASLVSILHYYRTHKNQASISAVLIAPAVVFGLFWFSYFRTWLQRRDVDHRWGTLTFAGGILFAATGGVAGGALAALGDSPDHMTSRPRRRSTTSRTTWRRSWLRRRSASWRYRPASPC